MKRARAIGAALTIIGASQIALILAPGEPEGRLLLAVDISFTVLAAVMVWQPEWTAGKGSTGYLQQEAGGSWLLLCVGGAVIGLATLALAVGSTVGV